jgi:hypothetical protein
MKARNIKYLLLWAFFCPALLLAQNVEPCISILAVAGNSTEIDGKSYTFTVGEMAIATLEGETRLLSQGFNQPECGRIISFISPPQVASPLLSVYPNPTTSLLTIELERHAGVYLSILDVNGREILKKEVDAATYRLDCADLPAGLYFLQLRASGFAMPQSFPFIKI